MNKDIENFKNVLSYFIAHLEYFRKKKVSPNSNYPTYSTPAIASKINAQTPKTGKGYSGSNTIQNQISGWDTFTISIPILGQCTCKIGITVNAFSGEPYASDASYLHWLIITRGLSQGTGVNVNAIWDSQKQKIEKLKCHDLDNQNSISKMICINDLNDDKKVEEFFNCYKTLLMKSSKIKYMYNKIYTGYVSLLTSNHNLILTGAPGTGKTYLAKEIAKAMTGDNEAQYEMVQFHPSYDYSDFVEGLRPVKDAKSGIGFERKDGVFKAFCKKALVDYNENKSDAPKYVFIIDEINRGEMSKIFGELFFSIDPGYRGIDGRIKTQYANLTEHPNEFDKALGIVEQKDTNGKVINAEDFGYFFVPENVYIIGTMNDIDRSVESMDFAMRRRFAFKEVRATDRETMLDEKITDSTVRNEAIKRMRNVNYRIQTIEGLNEAYHIGPAYFGKIEGNNFTELWNNHIKGLLYEYLRGMPNAKELLDSLERAYQETELYVKLDNNGDLELDASKSEDWKNKIVNKQ